MGHMTAHMDDIIQVEGAVDNFGQPVRNVKRKTRSKVWDEYKPIFVNGKIHSAECSYCHNRLSSKDSTGTSHLWRHLKICPAREGIPMKQQKDSYFPYVTVHENDHTGQIIQETFDEITPVVSSESRKWKSKVWEEFTPVFVNGKLQSADCIYCRKRLSANSFGGRSHLNRHLQTCPARDGMSAKQQRNMYLPSNLPQVKSKVQEFTPLSTNGKVHVAECSYSGKLLGGINSGGTSQLKRHLQTCSAPEVTSIKQQKTSYFLTASPDTKNCNSDQEASYGELARMIVLHGYPLSIVEHDEFSRFIMCLNPMFSMVSHNIIEEHCKVLFEKEKAALKEKLALSCTRVSLSASVWVPDEADPAIKYLCLTAHFLDQEWVVHKKIIKFGLLWSSPTNLERMLHFKEGCVVDSESGSYNVIWDAIRDWNLDQKLLSMTSVGEIGLDENFSKLKDKLMEENWLPIKGKLYNASCMDDALNNIVQKGRQNMLDLVGDLIENFLLDRASSSLHQQQLTEVISQLGMKCPCEDAKWWHKIYFRLEVFLHFKKLFPSEELISSEETKVIECVCKILRTFYHAVEVISGSSSPTSNLYFNELWKVRAVLQEEASNCHTVIAEMVKEMQEVFDEYWQNSYLWLSIPVVLDPRFKFGFIEFRLKRAFGGDAPKYISDINETIRALFDEYSSPVDKLGGGASNYESHDGEMDADDSDSLEDWDQHLNAQARNQVATELDNYFEDGLVPRKDDFDILNWWASHTSKYPTLARIAQDILAMPASAVQSEAAFSCRGPVIPKCHSTLSIKTIEALVCTRDWIS